MLKVDTSDAAALRAQLHEARAGIKDALQAESRRFAPLLVQRARSKARGGPEQAIAASGKVTIAKDGFTVSFGRTGRLSGGAKLREVTGPYEFGTKQPNRFSKPYRMRSPRGKAYKLSRRTMKQLPAYRKTGRFLHPALADVAPDLVGGYVRAIIKQIEP